MYGGGGVPYNTAMAPRRRILLVDDDADHLRACGGLLAGAGYAVKSVPDARAALEAAAESVPDLVLSDVSMPGCDGLSLLARLRAGRATARVPVVLLSGARTTAKDIVAGLDGGADDYLRKPAPPVMILAKVAAVLRRCAVREEAPERLEADGLVLDAAARTVKVAGRPVELTRKEFDLLAVFLRGPGRVRSAPYLLRKVWGYDPADYSNPRTICVHVSTLRRKVGARIAARIVAVPNKGYRFDA